MNTESEDNSTAKTIVRLLGNISNRPAATTEINALVELVSAGIITKDEARSVLKLPALVDRPNQ